MNTDQDFNWLNGNESDFVNDGNDVAENTEQDVQSDLTIRSPHSKALFLKLLFSKSTGIVIAMTSSASAMTFANLSRCAEGIEPQNDLQSYAPFSTKTAKSKI